MTSGLLRSVSSLNTQPLLGGNVDYFPPAPLPSRCNRFFTCLERCTSPLRFCAEKIVSLGKGTGKLFFNSIPGASAVALSGVGCITFANDDYYKYLGVAITAFALQIILDLSQLKLQEKAKEILEQNQFKLQEKIKEIRAHYRGEIQHERVRVIESSEVKCCDRFYGGISKIFESVLYVEAKWPHFIHQIPMMIYPISPRAAYLLGAITLSMTVEIQARRLLVQAKNKTYQKTLAKIGVITHLWNTMLIGGGLSFAFHFYRYIDKEQEKTIKMAQEVAIYMVGRPIGEYLIRSVHLAHASLMQTQSCSTPLFQGLKILLGMTTLWVPLGFIIYHLDSDNKLLCFAGMGIEGAAGGFKNALFVRNKQIEVNEIAMYIGAEEVKKLEQYQKETLALIRKVKSKAEKIRLLNQNIMVVQEPVSIRIEAARNQDDDLKTESLDAESEIQQAKALKKYQKELFLLAKKAMLKVGEIRSLNDYLSLLSQDMMIAEEDEKSTCNEITSLLKNRWKFIAILMFGIQDAIWPSQNNTLKMPYQGAISIAAGGTMYALRQTARIFLKKYSTEEAPSKCVKLFVSLADKIFYITDKNFQEMVVATLYLYPERNDRTMAVILLCLMWIPVGISTDNAYNGERNSESPSMVDSKHLPIF